MYTLLSIVILIVCILLILIVLVQNSKGGGLAANFGGSNQVMGVRRTTDFLEKATWTLAATLLTLSILISWTIPKPEEEVKSRMERQIENQTDFDQSLPPIGSPNEFPVEEE